MIMKVSVYDLDGKSEKRIDLPEIFEEEIRPDLINRACVSLRSKRYQPKGVYELAGLQTTAEYVGRRGAYRSTIGTGRARLPRVKIPGGRRGEVRRVPQARGGRRAHPPKPRKILVEKINKKERRKAIRSAIAATASIDYVKKRCHSVSNKELPIVVDNAFESLKKTKDVKEVLEKLDLGKELEKGAKKTIRSGRGKTRGRKYRRKKRILLVVAEDKGVMKAARSLAGVDISLAKNLNAELLAPGGVPGRLSVYSEAGINALKNIFR